MRFLLLLACLVLVMVAGSLGLLFWPWPYEQAEKIGRLVYVEARFARLPLPLTAARYAWLLRVLGAGFIAGLLGTTALLRQYRYRRELRGLASEVTLVIRGLLAGFRSLTRTEICVGLGLLVLITAMRAWLLVSYGFRYDELASYLFFVREGPAVIASYYPLPNNHVLFNLGCALLNAPLHGHPLLIMRLPSFLAASAGMAVSYVLLARFSNFRVATLVTGLFNLSPAGLFYAISGRGYYVQFVLIQLSFFAVVGLGCRPQYRRVAWLVLVLSSILGLYTIPTYGYALASLLVGAALVLGNTSGKFRGQGRALALATGLIATAAVCLYAPVVAVSGWDRLTGNAYVAPATWDTFRQLALANIYEKLNEQFGMVRLPLVLGGALLALAPLVLRRMALSASERSLGWATWALLVVPVGVVLAQRAYPPTRAVVYLAYFGFLFAALGLGWASQRHGRLRISSHLTWALLIGVVLGSALARFGGVLGRVRSSRHEDAQLAAAWRWLATRHPSRVLLDSYQLFFYSYALHDNTRVVLADLPVAGRRYDYLVLPPKQEQAPAWCPPHSYQSVFRNDLVSIFALQPTTPAAPSP